jgi:hypothetical protein
MGKQKYDYDIARLRTKVIPTEDVIAPPASLHALTVGIVFCLIVVSLAGSTMGQLASLTGTWSCDDGGSYYIRQRGAEVFWFGEPSSTDPHWSNVAHGEIDSSGRIRLSWADVPKGRINSGGLLTLQIENNGSLIAVTRTGGFGGSHWSRAH